MSTMQVTEQLTGIIDAMRADSYEVSVLDATPSRLTLSIDALDGACEDCLAPHGVLTQVVSGALAGRYAPEQIEISYPPKES